MNSKILPQREYREPSGRYVFIVYLFIYSYIYLFNIPSIRLEYFVRR